MKIQETETIKHNKMGMEVKQTWVIGKSKK